MSRRRGCVIAALLLLWLVVVLPLWLIGIGYEARGIRLPSLAGDKLNDLLIFYLPPGVAAGLALHWAIRRLRG